MFSQFDRLLIGALLGPVALTAYVICLQVAQQVHALPAAMFSYLLPRMSQSSQRRMNVKEVDTSSRQALIVGLSASILLGGSVMLAAKPLLLVWMGPEFTDEHVNLLRVLIFGYMILSSSVVPHFLLLSMGRARFVSILNLLGGAIGLLICYYAISPWGIMGAAGAKLILGVILSVTYFFFFRTGRKHVA